MSQGKRMRTEDTATSKKGRKVYYRYKRKK